MCPVKSIPFNFSGKLVKHEATGRHHLGVFFLGGTLLVLPRRNQRENPHQFWRSLLNKRTHPSTLPPTNMEVHRPPCRKIPFKQKDTPIYPTNMIPVERLTSWKAALCTSILVGDGAPYIFPSKHHPPGTLTFHGPKRCLNKKDLITWNLTGGGPGRLFSFQRDPRTSGSMLIGGRVMLTTY